MHALSVLPAADGRDQRQLVAVLQAGLDTGVLAVDSDADGHALEQLGQRRLRGQLRQRLGHGRPGGQAQLDAIAPRAFAQQREQPHMHPHRAACATSPALAGTPSLVGQSAGATGIVRPGSATSRTRSPRRTSPRSLGTIASASAPSIEVRM